MSISRYLAAQHFNSSLHIKKYSPGAEMLFLFIIIYNEHTDNLNSYDAKRNLLEQTSEHATEELLLYYNSTSKTKSWIVKI